MLLHTVGLNQLRIASGSNGPFRFVERIAGSHEPGLGVKMAALGVTVVIQLSYNLYMPRSN